jgi:hypothetical protein
MKSKSVLNVESVFVNSSSKLQQYSNAPSFIGETKIVIAKECCGTFAAVVRVTTLFVRAWVTVEMTHICVSQLS